MSKTQKPFHSGQTRNNLQLYCKCACKRQWKLLNLQTDCATVRKTVTNSVDKTHKNLFTVDIPETTCNFTANVPANGNGNCPISNGLCNSRKRFFCGQKQKASPKGRLFVSKTNIRCEKTVTKGKTCPAFVIVRFAEPKRFCVFLFLPTSCRNTFRR